MRYPALHSKQTKRLIILVCSAIMLFIILPQLSITEKICNREEVVIPASKTANEMTRCREWGKIPSITGMLFFMAMTVGGMVGWSLLDEHKQREVPRN